MNNLTDMIATEDFKFITLTKDRFIRPSLKYYGEYFAEETALLGQFLSEDSLVLDIGANIGTHTLAFAKKVPKGEVWCFEPQQFVYQILCGNIAMNGFTNVRAFHCAVGKENGEIGVPYIDYTTPDNYGGLELRKYGGGKPEDYEMTPVISVDSLQLEDADLIKIDVDGMEEEVLRGAFQTIFRCKPVLYVEANPGAQRNGLIGFLGTLGYRIWDHQPKVVRAASQMVAEPGSDLDDKAKENLAEYKNYTAHNLLCIPKESFPVNDELIKTFNLTPILM